MPPLRSPRFLAATVVAGCLLPSIHAQSQLSQNMQDWMRRINSGEFAGGGGRGGGGRGARGGGRAGRGGGGAGAWLDGGKAYVAGGERVDTATGATTELPAEPSYRPPGMDRALAGGAPSADGKKLLFATNSHTVMIRKTASDYWVLDKSDNSWHKLGGKSTAGLMFAKFSPDGNRVAYLGDLNQAKGAQPKYNLYVEDVRSRRREATHHQCQRRSSSTELPIGSTTKNSVSPIASCGAPTARRSPTTQFDQSDVPEFALDQLHRSTVSRHHQVQIPQARPDQLRRAAGRRRRRWRPHALDQDARRSAQYLHPAHGMGCMTTSSSCST